MEETMNNNAEKVTIIGVRFRQRGKVYYFSPGNLQVQTGADVIVETVRGTELGHVVYGCRQVSTKSVVSPLREIVRIATAKDKEIFEANLVKEKDAMGICIEKCRKHNLEMKIVDCEYTFDGSKLLFYFTADGRVDFRELVKDLASVFRTRIELRQIGVRDETKLLGGIGICGRELCCASYLNGFVPVSVKMAKEQNLSLNPTKISGSCGRLMCCLKYEEESYEYLNGMLPNVGAKVVTPDGYEGDVVATSVLKQKVRVAIKDETSTDEDAKEIKEYDASELKFQRSGRNFEPDIVDEEEAKALEELEKKDASENAGAETQNDDRNHGEKNRGDRNRGDRSHGDRNHGNKNHGEKNHGEKNGSDKTPGEKNQGSKNHNRNRRHNKNRNHNKGENGGAPKEGTN